MALPSAFDLSAPLADGDKCDNLRWRRGLTGSDGEPCPHVRIWP